MLVEEKRDLCRGINTKERGRRERKMGNGKKGIEERLGNVCIC